jgi:hypothetical protein
MSEQVITSLTVRCEDLKAAGNKTFPFQEGIEAPPMFCVHGGNQRA